MADKRLTQDVIPNELSGVWLGRGAYAETMMSTFSKRSE